MLEMFMKQMVLALIWVGLLSGANCFAQQEVLNEANRLELEGHFKAAADLLSQAIGNKALSPVMHKELEFEADRLERIKKDYPDTRDQLFAELKKSVKGLTPREFAQWIIEQRFDSRSIDSQRYFMKDSVANLFFRYPELQARRLPPKDSATLDLRRWQSGVAIKKAALAENKRYVLPKRFQVTMTVIADPNSAPDGQTLRAWLPIPRQYPLQSDFKLISASPVVEHLDPPESSIRSAYFEQSARKDEPAKFTIQYEYTGRGVWFDAKPEEVKRADLRDPELEKFTLEAPHVVFTPEMRALSEQIAAGETNPYREAKKFYDWIADHIQYSFAIEYSTIRNISDYCRAKGYGDCGQEALLFITLCRLNGIPARWQSGWSTFPGGKFMHDWTELYLAPSGWIPVDPYMGIYAMRYATTLTPEQRREIRDFYFGGLDQYRLIANSDHSQPLNPPKRSMRSDNVDFQRGELEWGDHNVYFDHYSYDLSVQELGLPGDRIN
jgi:transglutaminase-like putative cysteine protease